MTASPCALLFGSVQLFGAAPGHGWNPSIDGAPVLRHTEALRRAGVEEIALVAPSSAAAAAAKLDQVRIVLHSGEWNTAFDEIVLGLFALDRAPVLVLPIAHEVVSDEALASLLVEARRAEASHAIVPIHDGRSGYPIVLLREGVDAVVREAANPRGLRDLERILESWKDAVRVLPIPEDRASPTSERSARV